MRSFAKKQYQLENPVSSSVVRANIATIGLQHRRSDSEELDTPPTATAFPRFEHDFLRIHVHPPAAGALKTKLLINKPGDEYERDAERISQQAMRAPELQLQRACTCGGTCPECQARHSAQATWGRSQFHPSLTKYWSFHKLGDVTAFKKRANQGRAFRHSF